MVSDRRRLLLCHVTRQKMESPLQEIPKYEKDFVEKLIESLRHGHW